MLWVDLRIDFWKRGRPGGVRYASRRPAAGPALGRARCRPAADEAGLAWPLDQPRRLDSFKAKWRGWWSFWIFLALFVLSCSSFEFIANDRC